MGSEALQCEFEIDQWAFETLQCEFEIDQWVLKLFNEIAMSFKDFSKWFNEVLKWFNEVLKYSFGFHACGFYPADATIVVRNDQKR